MAKEKTTFEDARQQIMALPRPVQNWMRWLNVVFLAGLWFLPHHNEVCWVIAAYVVCFPIAVPFYIYTKNISMSGVPHILFWTPLLIYLPAQASAAPNFSLLSFYGVWTVLLLLTITISVVLDTRAVLKYLLSNA